MLKKKHYISRLKPAEAVCTPLAYSNLPGVQPRRRFSKVVQIKDSSNLYYFIYIKVSRQNSKI